MPTTRRRATPTPVPATAPMTPGCSRCDFYREACRDCHGRWMAARIAYLERELGRVERAVRTHLKRVEAHGRLLAWAKTLLPPRRRRAEAA